MVILKLFNRKYSEKHKKRQPTENQKNTQTEIQAKWGFGFQIWLARGLICPSAVQSVTPLQQTLAY